MRRGLKVAGVLTCSALLIAAGTSILRASGVSSGPAAVVVGLAPLIGLLYVLPLGWSVVAAAVGRTVRPLAVAVVAVIGLGAHAFWLLPLYVEDAPKSGTRLTVATVNLEYGRADPAAVVRLVEREDIDVVAIQELTPDAVVGLRSAGIERVLPHAALADEPGASGIGVWSRYPLSPGVQVPGMSFRSISTTVAAPDGPVRFFAVHPFPPLPVADNSRWQRDHAALRGALALERGQAIVAGDFNATPDHRAMRKLAGIGFRNAADLAGAGLLATWPLGRSYPPLFAIDHVLVTGGYGVSSYATATVPGTDHRAVVAGVVVGGRS